VSQILKIMWNLLCCFSVGTIANNVVSLHKHTDWKFAKYKFSQTWCSD